MEPDWQTTGMFGAARAGRPTPEDPTGTQNLLAAISTTRGPASEALAAEGATRTAVVAVLRRKLRSDDPWRGTDDADGAVAATDVLGEHGDQGHRFTGAAATALRSAIDLARAEGDRKLRTGHVLRALLDGGDTRGNELLTACGTSPRAVLARLDGRAEHRDDGLAPPLHHTRDVLLGRARYRRMPRWRRWVASAFGVNWAEIPVEWVRREADEQARRLGHARAGTEHVLLAVLATHEVVSRYPHFTDDAPTSPAPFAGGERLAATGIDHATVLEALRGGGLGLSADPRPVERYFEDAQGALPQPADRADRAIPAQSTGPLVEALWADESRARQVVHRLTPPART